MNKKNFLKGGMVDDDDIELKIEEIPEEETLINTSYKTLFIGIFLFCILYIFIFSISYYMDAENFYNNIMFTPLLFFVKSI